MENKNPLLAEHYAGIGRIIVAAARLESHVITALAAMLKIHRADAIIVFWHMHYNERIARLSTLFYTDHEDKDAPVRKEFETIRRRMENACSIRNVVAHGIWFRGEQPESIKPFVVRARGSDVKFTGRGLEPEEFTAERLIGEADKIDRLAADFREFFRAHYKARFVYKG